MAKKKLHTGPDVIANPAGRQALDPLIGQDRPQVGPRRQLSPFQGPPEHVADHQPGRLWERQERIGGAVAAGSRMAHRRPPNYVARWVDTHDDLDARLKEAVIAERSRITEVREYSLLGENNESSALSIDALLTNAGLLVEQASTEAPARRVKEMAQIQNSKFYLIKLTKSGKTLYAVRRTESSWQTERMTDAIYAFFSNNRLGLDDKPSFRISRDVDLFIIDDLVLISHKQRFESILAYKQAHVDDFGKLQVDNSFQAPFSNLEPLVAFVGTNEIRLRRACAIKDKGLKNAWLALMPRLWATTATEAPGRMDSSTISRFSA